jgi:hypothetical protein
MQQDLFDNQATKIVTKTDKNSVAPWRATTPNPLL